MAAAAGCVFTPPADRSSEGEVTLAFDLNYPKSLGYNISGVHVSMIHTLTGTVIDDDLAVNETGTAASGLIRNLRTGSWDLQVELFEGDLLIGSGAAVVEIVAGQTTKVIIKIKLETGNLVVIVDWGEETGSVDVWIQ
jgi:hypothetical protein